jgi:hypothetical protein
MAAYRTREKLREEIEGREEDDLPLHLDLQLLHDQTTSHQPNYFELDQDKFGLREDQPETIGSIIALQPQLLPEKPSSISGRSLLWMSVIQHHDIA